MKISGMKQSLLLLILFQFFLISCESGEDEELVDQNPPIVAEEETPQGPGILNEVIDPLSPPSKNFDVSRWNLSVPIFESNGTATDITTTALLNEYEHPTYFYTSSVDGALVFKNFIDGAKTSTSTKFTRVEFREMLYGTLFDSQSGRSSSDWANNWVFGSASDQVQAAFGAVDGKLSATVAINNVTSTGDTSQVGRVVIGQIHGSIDEPCRLYYRKLPDNTNGSIYFAHEPADGFGPEQWHELIGDISSSAENPEDGIALNEKFSYEIEVVENALTVTIIREGMADVSKTIDMTNSGFENDWMYFKAGAYTQNDSGDGTDYDQVSFYELKVTH